MLALYLHSDNDEFSKVFCPLLLKENLANVLEAYCLFLPWEITNEEYHGTMKEMLRSYSELEVFVNRFEQKKAALILIAPIKCTISVFGILQGSLDETAIIERVTTFCNSFEIEMECEKELLKTKNNEIAKIK